MRRSRLALRKYWISVPKDCSVVRSGAIVCSDALEFLGGLRPGCADIVFLDPPFNLDKKYGRRSDKLGEECYFEYVCSVLTRSAEVLKDGAALYLYHLPKWAVRFAAAVPESLTLRHWIAISMKNGFPRGKRLYPAHYALLYFTKGEPKDFRRPKIPPQKCRHCNGYVRDYGGYERFVRRGINLSDVWDDVSPVRHDKYKFRKANELPLVIPRRVVNISGSRGGLLVDPFAGSGSALVAAKEAKMNFLGCDREKEYCKIMLSRLRA